MGAPSSVGSDSAALGPGGPSHMHPAVPFT